MSKPIPIIMSEVMASANHWCLKHETRRIIGLDVVNRAPNDFKFLQMTEDGKGALFEGPGSVEMAKCRYGPVGSVLWIRENWAVGRGYDGVKPRDLPTTGRINCWYEADGEYPEGAGQHRAAIHLPYHFARQFVQTNATYPHRIQDITDREAAHEGILRDVDQNGEAVYWHYLDKRWVKSAKQSFGSLWVSINGVDTWDANVWVWAVKYKPSQRPTP